MASLRGSALLLALAAGAACAPRTVEDVEALARRAEGDTRATRKLVEALGASDPVVAQRAFDALLAMGAEAVPSLTLAVYEREPFAGQALRVIGAMGNPEYFNLLDTASSDPWLREDAVAAFDLAEQALWERISITQNTRLCDHYLKWFPKGAHVRDVRQVREMSEALQALTALGPRASEAQLISFIERFPGTPQAQVVRRQLAGRHLDAAARDRDAGRVDAALRAVEEARYWDPGVEADAVEAGIRVQLARDLAARNDLDGAVVELERAVSLGSEAGARALGEVLLQRQGQRMERGDVVGAMADLARAEQVAPELAPTLRAQRAQQVNAFLDEVRAGAPNRQAAAGALVVAAPERLPEVGEAVLTRLEAGDVVPLRGAAEAALRVTLPEATRAWLSSLLAEALQRGERRARALLDDDARIGRILGDADLWGARAAQERQAALGVLDSYITAVTLGWRLVEKGDAAIAGLPAAMPLSDQDLSLMLFQGRRPDDRSAPLLLRAQLMHHALDATARLDTLARLDPARVAVQFVGRTRLPGDLLDWAVLADDALGRSSQPAYAVPLPDGAVGELRHRVDGGRLLLELRTPHPGRRPADALLVDGLLVVMGPAQLLMAANPGLDAIELHLGGAPAGSWALSPRVTYRVSRADAARLDAATLRAAAPYDRADLSLVPRLTGL